MACECCVGKDGKIWAPFKGSAPKKPRELWPDNFVEEFEGWGTYYCPTCEDGLDEARIRHSEVKKLPPDAEPVTSPSQPSKVEISAPRAQASPTAHIWWLIGLAVYLCAIFGVWSLNQAIGRWMLVSTPLLILVAGAHYFAEGATPEKRNENFAENLLVVALSLVALWALAQCSSGAGDGPIDSYFRR